MSASTAASHTLPLRNCYWVVPGLLLAGEHPNGPTRDKTKERLKKLMGAGIECFVDLTKPTELLRYDTFLPFYVEYARKSIKDHGLPTGRSQMTEILEYIANSLRAGRPVYVHCRAGIGRTGTVVGCFLSERGLQGNAAIDELNRLWQQCRRSRSWPFVPETDAQAHYVREWTPTLESGFELSSLATAVATVGPMTTEGSVRGGMVGVAEGAGGLRARGGQADAGPAAGVGSGANAGVGLGTSAGGRTGRAGQGAAAGGGASAPGSAAGSGGVAPRAGQAAGAAGGGSSARAGKSAAAAGAGRTGGAGLRAAAEQARAAVERGEVQVKAPPVPVSTSAPTATPSARRGRAGAPNPTPNTASNGVSHTASQFELQKGEISPSIRAEIADAIAGRNSPSGADAAATPFIGTHGTAAPNGGEEAPWANVEDAPPARRPSAEPRAFPALGGAEDGSSSATARNPVLVDPRANARDTAADPSAGAARRIQDPTVDQPAGQSAGASRRTQDPVADHPAGQSAGASRRPRDPAADQPAGAGRSHGPGGGRQAAPDATGVQPRPVPPVPAPHQPPVDPGADADPLLNPETLAAARGLRERFVGTLFGLAVGDAVAAATQFRRPGSFSPVGDMLGGGPFDLPRGAWSDDTAMALCLAESLLDREGFDARDQVQRYSRWQQDGYLTSTGQCVGITASTARSLALAKWRRGAVFPGSHDPDQLDPEPLSRIASIALFYFSSLETTLLQAADSARITCQAPAVLDACKRLARAVNAALSGLPKTKILAEAGPLSETAAQTNNDAATALSAAFWAFSSTDNFRDAILRAANVGGNSDVVATVCGQLAGAHYGATAIPQSWRSGLMQKDLIEGIADRLLAHALVSLSS